MRVGDLVRLTDDHSIVGVVAAYRAVDHLHYGFEVLLTNPYIDRDGDRHKSIFTKVFTWELVSAGRIEAQSS